MWFSTALARRGHNVVAAARREQPAYSGLRSERVARVAQCCQLVWNAPFGSPRFLDAIEQERPFDVLCHHGAETEGYKSAEFDAIAATATNTNALTAVLHTLHNQGCRRIMLTGSIFEAGEGAGTSPLRAFSAYGLSKTLTSQIFAFYAAQEGFALGKVVIPNPFGPYEEPRFTDYLVRCWRDGKAATVTTPLYVRDNIHVSLLTDVYCGFATALPEEGFHKTNPSGYAETQGSFAARFAREIGMRLRLDTALEMTRQSVFDEPAVRINTDVVEHAVRDWNEEAAWDQLADYYALRFDIPRR
jgi:UDP-glucose 4-epimerase